MKHVLLSLAFLLAPSLALASAELHAGAAYILPKDAVVPHNLYLASEETTIEGSVAGDVVSASGSIVFSGEVDGDLILAGGDIAIEGDVDGDVRVAGGDVVISGSVGGDVLVFSGTLTLLPESSIGGDVIVFSGEVTAGGSVKGAGRIYASELLVSGSFGSLTADAEQIVLEGANIRGDFSYRSPHDATIDAASVIGGTLVRVESPNGDGAPILFGVVIGGFFVGRIIALIIAALVLFWVARGFVIRLGMASTKQFGRNALWGLLFLVGTPLAAIILFLSLLGIPLASLFIVGYATFLLLATLVSGIVAGAILSRLLVKETRVTPAWIMLGVIVMQLVSIVPVLGWLVHLAVYLATLGILARGALRLFRGREMSESSLGDTHVQG